MKTYFIFLCLIVGSVLTEASTQTTANQDKPSRLYVKSYSMSDSGFYDSFYESDITWDITFNGNANWSDGSAGTASWTSLGEDSSPVQNFTFSANANWNWLASSWPNQSATFTEIYYFSDEPIDDFTYTNTGQAAPVFLEHCDINITTNYVIVSLDSQTINTTERRTAQTTMRLQTGGRALSSRRNLFVITGGGNQINPKNPFYASPDNDGDISFFTEKVVGASIPSQSITIGNLGNLGSDGNLYVALPDNADVDVTPSASVSGVDYYSFGVGAQKYELTISANTNDLSATTPEFCVGQQVNLKAAWSPSLPSGTQTNYQWIASLDFVNSALPPINPDGSTYPDIDPTLLTNNPASVWWYSGGYKYLWCNVNCRFSNGQTAAVTGEGNVSIYTPQVEFSDGSPAYPMLYGGFMELGDEGTAQGNMTFAAEIFSTNNFPGTANWTQLNNRSASYPNAGQDTDGEFWLDTSQFYNNSTNFPPTSVNPIGTVHFKDAPGVSDVFGFESITDSFKTYLVFQPTSQNGASNIWVTLGIVSWGWSATESAYTLSATNVTQAAYSGSDQFPTWVHTGTGRHN